MTAAVQPLSSQWGGLSSSLIASFWEVDRDGKRVQTQSANGTMIDGPVVMAPLSEANLDVTLGWQSPFEQMGPETKAPTLFAMLQSGALQPIVDAANNLINTFNPMNLLPGQKPSTGQTISPDTFKQFIGRTGITKLNSIQVFSGMPPVKIPVTAIFRAWSDPVTEVENPVDQLMSWALPVNLAANSTPLSNMANLIIGTTDWLNALLPSLSPTLIAMKYKGRTYSPLVIESIGYPISSPIDENGKFVELSVPMTLCSLAAIDRGDWITMKNNSQPVQ